MEQVRAAIAGRQEGDDEVFRYILLSQVAFEPAALGRGAIIIPLAVPEQR
jgi:hypothetical protein